LGVRGLSQKSKNNVLYSATWRDDGQKWLDSTEKQKRRIDLKEQRDKQTDGHTYTQTDRVNDKKIISLGAEINKVTAENNTTRYATLGGR